MRLTSRLAYLLLYREVQNREMEPELSTSTTIELSISCRGLCDMDLLSKSDPLVVVFEKSTDNTWKELGRTEVIQNTLNPDFAKMIMVEYHFEEQQRLNFAVYDVDCSSDNLKNQDFLGHCEATLGEIASSRKIIKPLKNGPSSNCGTIMIVAEEVSSCKDELILDISGQSLDKKDLFGTSDPFLAFYRVNEDGSRTVVHRTEEIRNTLNPNWKQMVIPTRILVNGDHDRPLVISCLDWNRSGREALIGEVTTTVNELVRAYQSGSKTLNIVHPKKARRQKYYRNSGTLHLNLVRIERVYSFLEYVQGGTELSCCIAIDFTASNGSPQVPDTLHYSTVNHPSQYAMALQAVGEVISDYDSDNLFPAFGFGACVPPDNVVSHCFPLNGHIDNPYCEGIHGAMAAYAHSLRTVKFHGPTNFAPIINTVACIARQAEPGSQYSILLILTDGIISDLPQTRAAIVNASSLPLSIIIVGVGPANFDEMEELDGDEIRLTSRGRAAVRDIVQFVPFRDFHDANSVEESKRRLSKAVLAEIPDQLVSYMRMQGIKPLRSPDSNGKRDLFTDDCPPLPPNRHAQLVPPSAPSSQPEC
ncbi:Copine Va [Paragonimus heterotremus]|uniref:Copine-3 n=1 Tax=Paragonimus heterotremus TaxID=100268 RepID=A0A8J4SPA1_9TREM|nr:Copine Va [Paragonimus heterotremus]